MGDVSPCVLNMHDSHDVRALPVLITLNDGDGEQKTFSTVGIWDDKDYY
jgi:hypothetical protein